jgi:outer membrane receptor protein involved in Fe transport
MIGPLALLTMTVAVQAAPATTDEIEGTVKDALGRPLPGVSLTLKTPDEKTVDKAESDARGNFVFSGVAPGNYAVFGEKAGFQESTAVVTKEAGAMASAALTLTSREALELSVTAQRLMQARNALSPKTGGSEYEISENDINSLPQGQETPLNQVLLQAPGVANDSFGQLHVRGDHANIQYRIDGITLPEGITGFGQTLDTRFAQSVDLLTGAMPAQYGYREAGVVEIQTKSVFENGGRIDMYGGSNSTVEPSIQLGGSSGKLNYYFTGSYMHDDLGIENPTPSQNAIHDQTDQFKGFGYGSYLINPTTKLSVMFGSYDGFFQVPNRRQSPEATMPIGAANTPLGVEALAQLGTPGFDSTTLNEREYETNYYGIVALQSSVGSDIDYQIAYFIRDTTIDFTPDYIGDLVYDGVASKLHLGALSNGMQADGSYHLSDSHTIRGGFFGFTENVESDNTSSVFPTDASGDINGPPRNIVDNNQKNGNTYGALYLQDEWKATGKLTVNYGLRADELDAFVQAGQLSPRLGLVYKATDDTTLHAAYARYFTPPPTELVSPKDISLFENTTNAPSVNENSPVLPERSHYFDAGVTQKAAPGLNIGLDGFYKITRDLIDEGQFTEAPIYFPFNYSQGKIYGVELTTSYKLDNFAAYGNLARTVSLAKQVISSQFSFQQDELDYIANHWIHTDHDQLYTASGGVSYVWLGTKYTVDASFGTGLRQGFVNDDHVASNTSVNLGAVRQFVLGSLGPFEGRIAVINVLDKINIIRSGTGIGIFAPQYGPRIGFFGGISKLF